MNCPLYFISSEALCDSFVSESCVRRNTAHQDPHLTYFFLLKYSIKINISQWTVGLDDLITSIGNWLDCESGGLMTSHENSSCFRGWLCHLKKQYICNTYYDIKTGWYLILLSLYIWIEVCVPFKPFTCSPNSLFLTNLQGLGDASWLS